MRKTLAWLVHFYTALGLACAAGMAVLIVRGGDASFRGAFLLMMSATAIDATDGWLARQARVVDVLPGFDGRRLDDLIDFQTYVSLPLLLIWRADILPGPLAWLLLLPLFAGGYGFSQVSIKTADGFFLGFPSYWNIAALYLFVFQTAPWISVALIVTCSILTFVPTRYIYPSRGGPFALVLNIGSAIWFVMIGVMLFGPIEMRHPVAVASLAYPVLYLTLSAFVTVKRRS